MGVKETAIQKLFSLGLPTEDITEYDDMQDKTRLVETVHKFYTGHNDTVIEFSEGSLEMHLKESGRVEYLGQLTEGVAKGLLCSIEPNI